VYVVKLSISTTSARFHSIVILKLEPEVLSSFSLEINSSPGFLISSNPFPVILKSAISQVEPNLFFKLLKILTSSYLSPSKNKTVSTKCSKVFGPARFQSLFTCQIITMVVLVDFPKSTIFSATSFTCEILPAVPDAFSEVITEIESSTIISAFVFFKVSRIFSKLFSHKREIFSEVIFSLSALPKI
jgi:hypothetical protein